MSAYFDSLIERAAVSENSNYLFKEKEELSRVHYKLRNLISLYFNEIDLARVFSDLPAETIKIWVAEDQKRLEKSREEALAKALSTPFGTMMFWR